MWVIATALFFAAKLALCAALRQPATPAFVALWPGFDLRAWSRPGTFHGRLLPRACLNGLLGATLIWGIARCVPTTYLATWSCMIGFVILLHGCIFTALAAFWRRLGRDVSPLMKLPVAAASVTEFWGKRWNLGFRDLAHTLIFKPLQRRHGRAIAVAAVFLFSGIAHELVITIPARGGYGGPTLYFFLQAIAMWLERGCRIPRGGFLWRARTLSFLVLPLPLLFPATFVERVMHPFFATLHALP